MLLLVRHGETQHNVAGLLLGRADPPLTDTGQAQARALVAMLPRPDVVISSPLRRARDTAARFGSDVKIDERWTELDYGDLDGQPSSRVSRAEWLRWLTDPASSPPGGEPLAALHDRVREACEELVAVAATGVVVVVTHVSPIKAAVAWALDVPHHIAARMYVEDGSVTRVDMEDGSAPVVRWFNRFVPPAP